MVAAENLVVYAHRFEAIVQALGGDEIIDAPSCVLLTRFETVAPPRIGPFEVRIEKTERIGESTLKQTGELGTFFVGESRIFAIRAPKDSHGMRRPTSFGSPNGANHLASWAHRL